MYRMKSRRWLLSPILVMVALSLGLGVYGVQFLWNLFQEAENAEQSNDNQIDRNHVVEKPGEDQY